MGGVLGTVLAGIFTITIFFLAILAAAGLLVLNRNKKRKTTARYLVFPSTHGPLPRQA